MPPCAEYRSASMNFFSHHILSANLPAVDLLLSFEDEQITSMSKSLSSQSWLVVTGRFANWFTVQIIISVILLQ